MNQDLRRRFAELHKPGEPVLLYNIWDVASAKAVAEAGAPAAIATARRFRSTSISIARAASSKA